MEKLLRFVIFLCLLALLGFVVFWFLTRPGQVDLAQYEALEGDAAAGQLVFAAGGCASCHAAPNADGEAKLVLAGGQAFATDFGTFYAPNISPGAAGLGGWTVTDLANAMVEGVSPDGQHYYPAFPYTAYTRATPQDIADLHAYLATLPADETANRPHEVPFPLSWRRLLGGWKLLFFDRDWAREVAPDLERGRYLVEALGHCAECHTSRNALGGLDMDAWLAGGPNPDGKGRIPNITPHATGIEDWSELDIASYLGTGFTPSFDVAGGSMTDVIENMAQLPESDRQAIAAYLKSLPALEAVGIPNPQ